MKEFTFKYYKTLLNEFNSKNYEFIFFNQLDDYNNSKYVLLRHDIDFDLDKALKIAAFERDLGVKSTFFFLLNSEFYNIHHISNIEKILKILEMGHRISVHFDVGNYPDVSDTDLSLHVNKEIVYFKDLFGVDINIISFHRPDENVLMNKIDLNIDHTYMERYSQSIKYLSDSKKIMQEGDFIEIVRENKFKQMQLLIHPIWWNETLTGAQEDYENYLNNKMMSLRKEISANSKIFNV